MITDNFTINRYIIIASRSFLFFSYSLLLSSNISNESSQLNPTTHSFSHFIFNHFAIKSINAQNSIVPFLLRNLDYSNNQPKNLSIVIIPYNCEIPGK